MRAKNSKILTLKSEQNRLKFWNKYGQTILLSNAFLSLIPFSFATSLNLGLGFLISSCLYLGLSIFSVCFHELKSQHILRKRIREIDQEVLSLVKTDNNEFQLLKEHDKLVDMKNKVKKQERLIQQMLIKNKNNETVNENVTSNEEEQTLTL